MTSSARYFEDLGVRWGGQISDFKDKKRSPPYSQTSSEEVSVGQGRDGGWGTGCLAGYWQWEFCYPASPQSPPSICLEAGMTSR